MGNVQGVLVFNPDLVVVYSLCLQKRLELLHCYWFFFFFFFFYLQKNPSDKRGWCLSVCPQVFLHLWVLPAPLSLPASLQPLTAVPECTAGAPSRGWFSETQRRYVEVDTLTLWVCCHGAKCNAVVLTHIDKEPAHQDLILVTQLYAIILWKLTLI